MAASIPWLVASHCSSLCHIIFYHISFSDSHPPASLSQGPLGLRLGHTQRTQHLKTLNLVTSAKSLLPREVS